MCETVLGQEPKHVKWMVLAGREKAGEKKAGVTQGDSSERISGK